MSSRRSIPITIITGYVGSGKTTLILNLLPQLRAQTPTYRLALIKNEIGDLNVDSQLAAAAGMSGTRELLGACICCSNIGQIGEALAELEREYDPDRIVIETSGSAEPIKLVMEIKRLSAATADKYELDGIISVIDVVNWAGYANTSFTAKLQARQTDLIVLNKWEDAGDEACETCLDRLGDMDVETPHVKSDRGWINKDLLFGLDAKSDLDWSKELHTHASGHGDHHHMDEMECLSVTLGATDDSDLDLQRLEKLLINAPKDEIFRIKAVVRSKVAPRGAEIGTGRYILNWAFGRYTWTAIAAPTSSPQDPILRMSIFTARSESSKWHKRLETGQYVGLSSVEGCSEHLTVKRVQ